MGDEFLGDEKGSFLNYGNFRNWRFEEERTFAWLLRVGEFKVLRLTRGSEEENSYGY